MQSRSFLLAIALATSSTAFAGAAIDPGSRLGLVRSAAQKAALAEVGLDHRDLYGVIHAESGWVARNGMGKNGVVSEGIAQFEPATARAVGLRNPHDPKQSVDAAAVLLREAAQWSARRLQGLNLDTSEWAQRLREGVSIYYNLSTRSRNAWNGRNSHQMPIETQHHIRNARHGAIIATRLEGGVAEPAPMPALPPVARVAPPVVAKAVAPAVAAPVVVTAAAPRVTATISGIPNARRIAGGLQLPQGTIQWSTGTIGIRG